MVTKLDLIEINDGLSLRLTTAEWMLTESQQLIRTQTLLLTLCAAQSVESERQMIRLAAQNEQLATQFERLKIYADELRAYIEEHLCGNGKEEEEEEDESQFRRTK